MLDPIINGINTVLGWILNVVSAIAQANGSVAYYAGKIPLVGTYLANFFSAIQGFFNDIGYNLIDLTKHVKNGLNTIDDWLDKVKSLWDQVFGWITDTLMDAYNAAKGALDWIVDTGHRLVNDVYGWITDTLTDAYNAAKGALDWIVDLPSHLAPFLDALKADILQPIAPFINLISFFFEDINSFFSDPLGSILSTLLGIARKYEQLLLDILDKIGDALFGD
jgi:phage-related protein